MTLKENQILITCAGNVGTAKLITKEFEEKIAIGSQDIIRVESKDKEFDAYYLYAYFTLDFVYSYINSLSYGSVIERIEPFHVESIPVLKLPPKKRKEVSALIKAFSENMYASFKKEEKAIKEIEKEIETWQK